jgi:hypothetical protein
VAEPSSDDAAGEAVCSDGRRVDGLVLDKEGRACLYAEALPVLTDFYGAFTVAGLFLLGAGANKDRSSVRSGMNAKCRPPGAKARESVSQSDVLPVQLLCVLHNDGFDLGDVEFDDAGKLKSIPRRLS